MKHGAKAGFTLTELLLVIAIIAALAAILLPVLSSAKAKARRAACINNLRQINLGVRLYSDDANDTSPSAQTTNRIVNWNGQTLSLAMSYNPPAGYDYQWSAD
jgi:prepilin-type N-terminal cleavage/methylation domain-containing protein